MLLILGICLAIVIGYVGYVFLSFNRIDDKQTLEVNNNAKDQLQTGQKYSAITYNVGFGAYSADYSFFMDGGKYSRALSEQAVYDNIGGAIKTIQQYNPDFILAEEVGYDSTNSYHVDQRQLFYDGFPSYGYVYALNNHSPYLFYPLTSPFGKNNAGILTLSRYEIADSIRRQLPIETGFSKLFDLDRCYSVTSLKVAGDKMLYIYSLHLSAYTTDGTIADEQIEMLMQDMKEKQATGAYVMCGGDFNKDLLGDSSKYFGVSGEEYTWAQAFPVAKIPSGFSLVAPSNVPSCRNADRPYDLTDFVVTIDGFIISDNITMVSSQVVDTGFAYSDHNPVYMEFILN